jgi:hypothetical protein
MVPTPWEGDQHHYQATEERNSWECQILYIQYTEIHASLGFKRNKFSVFDLLTMTRLTPPTIPASALITDVKAGYDFSEHPG